MRPWRVLWWVPASAALVMLSACVQEAETPPLTQPLQATGPAREYDDCPRLVGGVPAERKAGPRGLGLRPADLLAPGARQEWDDGTPPSTSRLVDAGWVELPSGRLLVFDPGWASAVEPARETFATGLPARGRVCLQLVSFETNRRVGAAVLALEGAGPVTSWRLDPRDLPVDAGMGAFADAERLPEVSAQMDDEVRFLEFGEAVYRDGSAPLDGGGLGFDSGMGDGGYDVWLGRRADGSVGMVLVDFELFQHAVSWSPDRR